MTPSELLCVVVPRNVLCRSWPGPPDKRESPAGQDGMALRVMPLRQALAARWEHEAYFLMRAPTTPVDVGSGAKQRRLSLDVLREPGWLELLGGSIVIRLGFADIDAPKTTGPDGKVVKASAEEVEDWFETQVRGPLNVARHAYPGLGAYRSKGGLRLIWIRETPIEVRTLDDAAELSRRLWAENTHWERRFGLKRPDDLKEFERFQRVPHDTREGDTAPAELETWGLDALAPIELEVQEGDYPPRKQGRVRLERVSGESTEASEPALYTGPEGGGLLLRLIQARGLRCEHVGGDTWDVHCPNHAMHSEPEDRKSKTRLYDGPVGFLVCMSNSCALAYPDGPSQLEMFSEAEREALAPHAPEPPEWMAEDDYTPEPPETEAHAEVGSEPTAYMFDGAAFSTRLDKESKRWFVPPTLKNLTILLASHPGWRGALRHNLMRDELELSRVPDRLRSFVIEATEFGGRLIEAPQKTVNVRLSDYVQGRLETGLLDPASPAFALWAGEMLAGPPRPETLVQAAVAVARSYHPVRDYLNALPPWDGKPRCETLFIAQMGAEDTELNRAYTRKWLISAVARAMVPGCQADHMLILSSFQQGLRKSTFFADLCADRSWFDDGAVDITSRDSKQKISKLWLYEFSELEGMSNKDAETVKGFITSRVDVFRVPYGHVDKPYPRQCALCGTTNSEAFSQDDQNRRFWTITVTKRAQKGAAAALRDQVWAEALHYFAAGEDWWLEGELEEEACAEQASRISKDAWATMFADQVYERFRRLRAQGQPGLLVKDALEVFLRSDSHGLDGTKMKTRDTHRASRVLKTLGFRPERVKARGEWRDRRVFVLPDAHPASGPRVVPAPSRPARSPEPEQAPLWGAVAFPDD